MTMLILRLIHIGLGVFWAGTAMFFAFYVEPTVRSMGPDGGKFMRPLMSGSYLKVMPLATILTILSGFWLLYEVSGGFSKEYLTAPMGIVLLNGALDATAAWIVGLTILRPTSMRIGALGNELVLAGGPPRPEQMAEMQALQAKARLAGRIIAFLLIFAVLSMAAARYVH